MKKTLILIVLLLAGLLTFSGVMAAGDEAGEGGAQSGNSEEVVAMCESKYDPEKYADEDERNNLIDKCISESAGGKAPKAEEG